METSELLKKVRRIEIKTRGLSRNIFAGQYHSAFKGRGMAFSEVREYQYGDDIRDIDWNVTARYVRPYIKVFEEERELTVMLLIDVSGSRDFGTANVMKKEVITEIAATLAFSAIQNNDKIGVIFFSDKVEKFIPPQKGKKHILYIIRELIDFHPEDKQTDIAQVLKYLTNAIKKRCTAFLISDFINKGGFKDALTVANRKHDMVAIQVYDQRETELPPVGLMKIKDADTIQIMKDYMANGRFSRGREVTGYASFSFVGNFDLNIPRIVNSYDHDLLVTLPEAFDLAVIDRIYNYIPGWEIPKIDDSAYNNNFGLITDYLSEALHYLFVHDSDYVGIVNARLKKGDIIEGRDNRALQKTISGFIKLLYPTGQPTDEEFDEIVEFSELGEFINMPVRTYSSGMHLRLAFAVATIIRPEILLMDEWLSVGDAAFNEKAEQRLNNLVKSSRILVIASHSRELIERTCNRAMWFEHGRLKLDSDPHTVCQSYWGN